METIPKRFSRLELGLGVAAVRRLLRSRVMVVGIGGVGGIAAEILARTAIGNLDLVDIDTFQETDINRQIFATDATMGQPKVQAAADRLMTINPELNIKTHHTFFHVDTAETLLNPKPDFVIDAIDSVLPKVELIAYCHTNQIPIISVMGAAVRRDYSKISVSDIRKTKVCPLARVIRRRLKRRGIQKGIPCVYSAESGPPLIQPDDIKDESLRTGHTRGRERPVLGSYGPFINVFGILAADYVIQTMIRDIRNPEDQPKP